MFNKIDFSPLGESSFGSVVLYAINSLERRLDNKLIQLSFEIIIQDNGVRVNVDQKRLKIAIHEIGHAVMALFRGRGVLKVSLKGMDSPIGTDRYHGFTTLEPIDQNAKLTVNDALRSVMISLGGYASEILFFDVCTPGGDDLTNAEKWSKILQQVEEYRNKMASMPVPEPGPLDEIQNPQVRAYVHHMIPECARALDRLGPLIKFLAEELYKREELPGDEVAAHFDSFMQSSTGANH